MKNFFLSSLYLLPIVLLSQNWSPILTNEKMNFQHSDSAYMSHTIWVENFDVTGSDTTFFINKVVTNHPTDIDKALRNQPQFLYSTMIRLDNGVYHFADPGYYILYSQAELNESWVFDLDENLMAQVILLEQYEIFGIMDSVKTINLSNGREIKLSKSFGIIQFPDFESEGYYHLVGIQDSEYGESIPGFWDIYNFEIGDVFQYSEDIGTFDGSGMVTRKFTIADKEILSDSYQYFVDGIYNCFYSGMGGSGLESYAYTDQLTFINSVESPENKYPGEIYLLPNSGSGIGTDRVFASANIRLDLETGILYKEFGSKEENNVPYDADIFYELSETSDTLYRFEQVSIIDFPCGLMGLGFGSSIGDVFCSEGCFEYWDNKSLVGYIKDGDTVGNITPDTLLLVGISDKESLEDKINIYPNPASEILHILSPQGKNAQLEIRNIQGEVVQQNKISKSEEIIDVSGLSSGIYFYRIISEKESIKTGKLIIQ